MKISAVVAAAGLASRAGGEAKCLLPWEGKPLLHHLLSTLAQGTFAETVLVVGHRAEEVRLAATAFPSVRAVENPRYADGLGTSLACGVRALDDCDAVALFLADKPFIRPATLLTLLGEFSKHSDGIIYPSHEGAQGHPVIFSAKFRPELERLTGDHGAKGVLRTHENETLAVKTPDEGTVLDINTPEALARPRSSRRVPP